MDEEEEKVHIDEEDQNEKAANSEKENDDLVEDESDKEELSENEYNHHDDSEIVEEASDNKGHEDNPYGEDESEQPRKDDSDKETTEDEESEQEELSEGELNLFKKSSNQDESDSEDIVDLSETEEEKFKKEKKTKIDKGNFERPLGPLSRRQSDGNILKKETVDDIERPRTAQEKLLSPSPPAANKINKKKTFENRKIKRRQTEGNYQIEVKNLSTSKKLRPQSSSGHINTTQYKQNQTRHINEKDFIRPVLPLQKEHTVIETSSRQKLKDEYRPMTAPSKFIKIRSKGLEETNVRAPSRIVSARLSSRESMLSKEDETRPCSSPIRSSRYHHRGRFSPLRAVSVLTNDPQERPLSSGRPPSAPVEETQYNPSKTIGDENDTHRRTESPIPPSRESEEMNVLKQHSDESDVEEITGKLSNLSNIFLSNLRNVPVTS